MPGVCLEQKLAAGIDSLINITTYQARSQDFSWGGGGGAFGQ